MESRNLYPWDVTAIVAAGVTVVWPPVVDPTIPLLPRFALTIGAVGCRALTRMETFPMFTKTSNLSYKIVIIVVIGALSGFIGYTFPTQTPAQQAQAKENTAAATTPMKKTTTTTPVTITKTDGCGCCASRRARLQRQRQQARERKEEKQQTASLTSPVPKN